MTSEHNSDRMIFPESFLFGAATAAYQIEGGDDQDGRGQNIWDTFSSIPGAVLNGDNGSHACDHYHRYREDVALMKNMGLNSYRFSVSWSRVSPNGYEFNPRGIDFYSRLVDELREADILPWVTLYHWDLPQSLQDTGGWVTRDTANRFVDYALRVHEALGDRVDVWTTLNEPWCSSFLSYTGGNHAPGHCSMEEGMRAAHHLLLAHGQAINALRQRDSSATLGITLNLTNAQAVNPEDPRDRDAARRIDGQFNRWFLDPIFRGSYPEDILEDFRTCDSEAVDAWQKIIRSEDADIIATPIDVLGVNYYHNEYVSGTVPTNPAPAEPLESPRQTQSPFPSSENIYWCERGLPRTSMQWEVQPEGLTDLLVRLDADYTHSLKTRLFVTENGAAYDDHPVVIDGETRVQDAQRVTFVRKHVEAVYAALDRGVDVGGYFLWSLLDNFEWAWGYSQRFGIVYVDFDTQQRIIKDSGLEYANIIANSRNP